MQIKDPKTKASMFIERSKKAYAEGAEKDGWIGGKHAYIANVGDLPKKYRALPGNKAADVFAGGKAAEKIKAGVFGHFDKGPSPKQPNRVGITVLDHRGRVRDARTRRLARKATHGLVKMYQKRGFKIDKHDLPNDWNVPMKRTPGGGASISRLAKRDSGNLMGRIRSRARSRSDRRASGRISSRSRLPLRSWLERVRRWVSPRTRRITRASTKRTAKKALKPAVIAGAAIAGGALSIRS